MLVFACFLLPGALPDLAYTRRQKRGRGNALRFPGAQRRNHPGGVGRCPAPGSIRSRRRFQPFGNRSSGATQTFAARPATARVGGQQTIRIGVSTATLRSRTGGHFCPRLLKFQSVSLSFLSPPRSCHAGDCGLGSEVYCVYRYTFSYLLATVGITGLRGHDIDCGIYYGGAPAMPPNSCIRYHVPQSGQAVAGLVARASSISTPSPPSS